MHRPGIYLPVVSALFGLVAAGCGGGTPLDPGPVVSNDGSLGSGGSAGSGSPPGAGGAVGTGGSMGTGGSGGSSGAGGSGRDGAVGDAPGNPVDGGRRLANLGETCSGIAGIACAKGLFCEMAAGMCHVADLAGVCKTTPQVCPALYAPVCGCNGMTYPSDCNRQGAGAAKDRDGACATAGVLPAGSWGGVGITLTTQTSGGAALDFDCGSGTITGPLTVTNQGTLAWKGTFTAGSPVVRIGDMPTPQPASFVGQVTGDSLELRMTVPGGTTAYKLQRGVAGNLRRCL